MLRIGLRERLSLVGGSKTQLDVISSHQTSLQRSGFRAHYFNKALSWCAEMVEVGNSFSGQKKFVSPGSNEHKVQVMPEPEEAHVLSTC